MSLPLRKAETLVIGGGGELPEAIRDRFVELAGGPRARIVVIPTAHRVADGPDANAVLDPWIGQGVASVRLLHTRSRTWPTIRRSSSR